MQPRQNSIVWMAWCMKISEGTNCKVRGHVTIAVAGSPPPTKYLSSQSNSYKSPHNPPCSSEQGNSLLGTTRPCSIKASQTKSMFSY